MAPILDFLRHHGCNGRLCYRRRCGPLCGQKLSVEECPGSGHKRTSHPFKSCPLKSRHLSSRSRDRTSVVLRKIEAPRYRAVSFAERTTERRSQRRCCGVMRGTQPPPLSLGPASYPAAVACALRSAAGRALVATEASSKQSRRVSGGLSQHCIQL
jgi:hypothetical protein